MTQPVGTGLRVVFWTVAVLTGLTGLTMFLFPGPAGGQYWPWPLTPLVSRYLGALFIGVAVGAIVCARAQDWAQVKPLFPPGLTFTGLSIVATTIHFASFNPERWATWLFFALYGAVFVAGLAAYVQYERAGRAAAGRRATGSADPPEQTATV